MGDVSFFVTHGAAIWQALTAVSFVGGSLAAWKLVDRGMRARAQRVREGLGSAAPSPNPNDHGKPVTLSGVLSLEDDDAKRDAIGATVVPRGLEQSEEPTPKAKGAPAAGKKLALDVAGVKVLLDGPIEILVGSRETERCIGREKGQTLLWDFAGGLGTLPAAFGARVLSSGDRVIARGILRHDPEWGQSYREGSASFALDVEKGVESELRTIVLAFEGRPKPLARPKTRTVSRALVAPLAMFVTLCAVGEAAVRMHKPGAWAVAAATPFRRADGLSLLRDDVGLGTRATPEKIDRAIALDRLRGRCDAAIDDAFGHQQIARAAALAVECNDPWREANANVAMADFPRAAAAFVRARQRDSHLPYSLSEATAYIVAGKHADAAVALRNVARSWDDARSAHERLECAALYEEHRDPETGEAEVIETLHSSTDREGPCALLYFDSTKKAPDAGYYYGWRSSVMDVRSTLTVLALERSTKDGGEIDTPSCWGGAEELVFDPRRCVYDVSPAFVRAAIDTLDKGDQTQRSRFRRATLHVRLARLDSYLGEIADARSHIDTARALLYDAQDKITDEQIESSIHAYAYGYYNPWDAPSPEVADANRWWLARRAHGERQGLAMWDLALEVRAGDEPKTAKNDDWRMDTLMTAGLAKRGDHNALARIADRDARDANQKMWQLALSDDDSAFVQRLHERGSDGRGVVDFLHSSIRPELQRWVRLDYPSACTSCGLYPLTNQIVSRRDAAVAAHTDDVAKEMGEAARRIRTILYDRHNAAVLAVISELSPP